MGDGAYKQLGQLSAEHIKSKKKGKTPDDYNNAATKMRRALVWEVS
jgi:hypothetical protein